MSELQRGWSTAVFAPGARPPERTGQTQRAAGQLVMVQGPSDVQLVARMARGDQTALGEIYARHAPGLLTYLVTLTRDPAEAEEILQDTLVGAWQGARRFEGRSQVRTWLFAIARRQAYNRRRRPMLDVDPEAELEQLSNPGDEPEGLALAQVELAELEALVSRLSPVHREILELAFVHELAYAEIAQVLDVPIGTVKSRISNAKRALQRLLAERGEATE